MCTENKENTDFKENFISVKFKKIYNCYQKAKTIKICVLWII